MQNLQKFEVNKNWKTWLRFSKRVTKKLRENSFATGKVDGNDDSNQDGLCEYGMQYDLQWGMRKVQDDLFSGADRTEVKKEGFQVNEKKSHLM